MERCIKCNFFEKCFNFRKPNYLLTPKDYTLLSDDEECGICLELLKALPCIKTQDCNHTFHLLCYQEYLKSYEPAAKIRPCPYCNSSQFKLNESIIKNIHI